MEKFLILFLNHSTPGAQLWFCLHLCMWVIHRSLLLKLPWLTWVCPREAWPCRWHCCLDHMDPSGARCAGKQEATDTEDVALLEFFSKLWQLVLKRPPLPVLLYHSAQEVLKGQPWLGSFSVAPHVSCSMCPPHWGLSLLVSCWHWHMGRERLQWWLYSL